MCKKQELLHRLSCAAAVRDFYPTYRTPLALAMESVKVKSDITRTHEEAEKLSTLGLPAWKWRYPRGL